VVSTYITEFGNVANLMVLSRRIFPNFVFTLCSLYNSTLCMIEVDPEATD
jgi:hypothetical protein